MAETGDQAERSVTQLAGLGIGGFRSFRGGDLQLIAPLDRVNLLAGKNNTGKSNILRFMQKILSACHRGAINEISIENISEVDMPKGAANDASLELAIGLRLGEDTEHALSYIKGGALAGVLDSPVFRLSSDDIIWLRYTISQERKSYKVEMSRGQLSEALNTVDPSLHKQLLYIPSGHRSADIHWDLERVLDAWLHPFSSIPPVETIEAFREVRESESTSALTLGTGAGLARTLARLERPDIEHQEDKGRFEAINRFIRTVLEDPTVQIEIPHRQDTVHVYTNGLVLPLANLGTGVHQVVIIATAAILLANHLVCIEEPEIHLHPVLQRKLLRYLAEETNNRYLIATHSAHLLDSKIASIFHVTLSETGTKVRLASNPRERAAICSDLGYRPSDLVQANAIIWVEGPSDRIYLRHWISLLANDLIEGIHYSIMFYGGRLLNHLSADDPDLQEFISLRRLNRHIAILIDSDKRSVHAPIGESKRRIARGFDEGPGFAWITKGYTIENYIPPDLLATAIGKVHADAIIRWDGDLYANPLAKSLISGTAHIDKVAIARACVVLWSEATPWLLDLQRQVDRTIDFIRVANGRHRA